MFYSHVYPYLSGYLCMAFIKMCQRKYIYFPTVKQSKLLHRNSFPQNPNKNMKTVARLNNISKFFQVPISTHSLLCFWFTLYSIRSWWLELMSLVFQWQWWQLRLSRLNSGPEWQWRAWYTLCTEPAHSNNRILLRLDFDLIIPKFVIYSIVWI